jgi:hypothetical protein
MSGEGFSNLFDLFRVLCNYLCAKLFVKDYGLLASQAPNRYTDFVASSNYRSFDNHNYESDLQSANLIFCIYESEGKQFLDERRSQFSSKLSKNGTTVVHRKLALKQ